MAIRGAKKLHNMLDNTATNNQNILRTD